MAVVQTLIHDALVLFAMVNAVGNLPLFADLTAGMARPEKRRAFNTAVLTAAGIVVTMAFLGRWMLSSLFQVDTDSFKIAGGLLVFFVAARGLVTGGDRHPYLPSSDQSHLGVFPMGFPFLAGPGTIVTTILLMQEGGAWVTALAAVIVYALVLPILYLTRVIQLVAGRVGILVVSRLLYIFISAKAIAFTISGLKGSLGLGH
jgi:multiple antibiotic resistance protein